METVVDAFVWPLRVLGLAQPKEGELDHNPLLSIPPNCIVNHIVPALEPKDQANLALACTTILHLMSGAVRQLKFDGRQMCFAAKTPRLLQLSNVHKLQLTLRDWHDIGFAAPRLLLHLSVGLSLVDEVVLLDQSSVDEYEPLGTPSSMAAAAANFASSLWTGGGADPLQCDGCGYEQEGTDLACVLISLLALFPRLKRLEVCTKLLSDAEVSAVSRFPQLTSLTLNSEDGVMPGALCSLSALTGLRELRLGDVDGNNPEDVDTVCNMVSQLTALHMGYCPRLQPPVLNRLRQLHLAVKAYRSERAAEAAERARAASAGVLTKTAKAAVSIAGSVASSMLPAPLAGFVVSNAPVGPPESYQLLKEAGVPMDEKMGTDSGNTTASTAAMQAALDAISSTLPVATTSMAVHQAVQTPRSHLSTTTTAVHRSMCRQLGIL